MTYKTTTIAAIRGAGLNNKEFEALLKHMGEIESDNDPLELLTVLNSTGLGFTLRVMSSAMTDNRLDRHFQAWCVRQILHIFNDQYPNDDRVLKQIQMLENDKASEEERKVARGNAFAIIKDGVNSPADEVALAASSGPAILAADIHEALGESEWFVIRDIQENQLRKMIGEEALLALHRREKND